MALVETAGKKVNFAESPRRIVGVKKYTKNKGAEGNADMKELFILEELCEQFIGVGWIRGANKTEKTTRVNVKCFNLDGRSRRGTQWLRREDCLKRE